MILFFSIKILKKKEPLNLASNCKEEKDREFSIQQGVLDTVFTYRSRWISLDFTFIFTYHCSATRSRKYTRVDRFEAGWIVQGPTRRVGRSSNDRYAWLSALSPYSTWREGHEARRRARSLTWPSFLLSFSNGFPMRHRKVVPQHRDLHPRFNRFTGERLATSLWLSTDENSTTIIADSDGNWPGLFVCWTRAC